MGSYLDANWANVMWTYLTGSGLIDHATMQEIANYNFDAYATELSTELSFECVLEACRINVWEASEATQAISTRPQHAGGKLDPGLPANVALSIGWPLAVHYRGGHPRTYLCGITQASLGGTTRVSSSFAADVQQRAQNFHAKLEAMPPQSGIGSQLHGTLSFVNKGAWRNPPVFRRILDGPRVDTRLDSQRRRLGSDVP